MKQLITSHDFGSGQLQGNCGSRTAYRLKASYTTKEEALSEYNRRKQLFHLTRIQLRDRKQHCMQESLHAIMAAEAGRAKMRAYPIEWAFTDVLERIHTGSYALTVLTDTEDGAGDGHKGEFATRNFAKWLIRNDLMSGVDIAGIRPVNHDKTDYNMIGWILLPNLPRIDEFLAEKVATVVKYIEEANNDPALQEQEEARSAAQAETRAAIESGWEGFDIPEAGGEQPAEPAQNMDGQVAQEGGFDPGFAPINTAEVQRRVLQHVRRNRPVVAAPPPREVQFTRGQQATWRVLDDIGDGILPEALDEWPDDFGEIGPEDMPRDEDL